MIRPLAVTIPFPMALVTRIHIAALNVLWVVGTPAGGVDAACCGAGRGVDADSVGGPGTGTKRGIRVVGAVAVEGCVDGWEEGEEVHFVGGLLGVFFAWRFVRMEEVGGSRCE